MVTVSTKSIKRQVSRLTADVSVDGDGKPVIPPFAATVPLKVFVPLKVLLAVLMAALLMVLLASVNSVFASATNCLASISDYDAALAAVAAYSYCFTVELK
jgi:hypothetical protein